MNCLVTGSFGQCGTAIINQHEDRDKYNFTHLDRSSSFKKDRYSDLVTITGDIANYNEIRPAFDGQDAVIHLAALSNEGPWPQILENNIIGCYNVLEAAKDAGVETFVFASTNHVVGMYEKELAPDIYSPDFDLLLDKTDPIRPDSYYATSKGFGEHLARYYVENNEFPKRCYSLRICNVSYSSDDHPYAVAERAVEQGEYERDSEEYQQDVARMKAKWHSRRDFAHMIECCLEDESVTYDVFYGVSDNDRRWFDIEHAQEVIGYNPQDNAEMWDAPPKE